MKKILFCILLIAMMLNAQDIAGTYKMTGMYEQAQQISRSYTPVTIHDSHDLGLVLQIGEILSGEIFQWIDLGPYAENWFSAVQVNLFITFNEDGTGEILEGSYYPIVSFENCVAEYNIIPAMASFIYQSDLNSGMEIPYSSIIGPLTYQSPFMGETAGSIGLVNSTATVLPDLPMIPDNPVLCDGMGNCIDLDMSTSGGDFIPGGAPLPGLTGGYVLKGDPVLPTFLPFEGNDPSNLYIEYFTIDGAKSGLGLGNTIGEDEDGDGTDFDRIGSILYLSATYVNPDCGFNYPIFGDVTSLLESEGLESCIDEVDSAYEGYVMNDLFSVWGNFLTYNAAMYAQCIAIYDEPTCLELYGADDSNHDYNGTTDKDGRLIMEFDPLCVPMIYNFHGMWEWKEVTICDDVGDLNGDSSYDILDVVGLINCILSGDCEDEPNACAADVNVDGNYNILDVVALFNCILENNCDGL